jgi:hypothetical protein
MKARYLKRHDRRHLQRLRKAREAERLAPGKPTADSAKDALRDVRAPQPMATLGELPELTQAGLSAIADADAYRNTPESWSDVWRED